MQENERMIHTGWLETVPKPARQRIREIMDTLDPPVGLEHKRLYIYSVILSPSTGTAKNITLVAKGRTSMREVIRWEIMVHGILKSVEK